MSEYQHYEFLTVDAPLDAKALDPSVAQRYRITQRYRIMSASD